MPVHAIVRGDCRVDKWASYSSSAIDEKRHSVSFNFKVLDGEAPIIFRFRDGCSG